MPVKPEAAGLSSPGLERAHPDVESSDSEATYRRRAGPDALEPTEWHYPRDGTRRPDSRARDLRYCAANGGLRVRQPGPSRMPSPVRYRA
jgi:hypothetical protein